MPIRRVSRSVVIAELSRSTQAPIPKLPLPRLLSSKDSTTCRAFCNFSKRPGVSHCATAPESPLSINQLACMSATVSVCSRPKYATHVSPHKLFNNSRYDFRMLMTLDLPYTADDNLSIVQNFQTSMLIRTPAHSPRSLSSRGLFSPSTGASHATVGDSGDVRLSIACQVCSSSFVKERHSAQEPLSLLRDPSITKKSRERSFPSVLGEAHPLHVASRDLQFCIPWEHRNNSETFLAGVELFLARRPL